MNNTDRNRLLFFSLALIALPPLIYFYSFHNYAVNFLIQDDFDFLESAIRIDQSHSWFEKLTLIFQQHNEHRPALVRIIFLLAHYIFGKINFRLIALLGNLALLVLALLLFLSFHPKQHRALYYIPVSFLLFNLQNWNAMIWGPVSLQFNLVFCFALISFYFLRQHSFRHLMWALVFSGAATFTQGSGLITFAIGFVWLIGQKRFIEYGAWGIVTLVITGVYFFNYSTPGTESKIFSGLQEPGRMGVYFASFLGSALSFKNQIAAFILGLVVIAGFFYLTRRKYYELNGPIYCLLVFLLFSALAASMSRSGFGIDQALSYRYKTQSVLGIVALLIAFIELHSSKLETQLLPAVGLTLLSIIFFGFAYGDGTQKLFRQKEIHIENMNSWFAENSGLVIIQARRGNALMDSAIRKGYFRLASEHLVVSKDQMAQQVETFQKCFPVVGQLIDAGFNTLLIRVAPDLL